MQKVLDAPGKSAPKPAGTTGLAGKYLTFRLDREEYAIEVRRIREITGTTDLVRSPRTSDALEGTIPLRGKTIPVVDLRARIGLPRVDYDERTCVIVLDLGVMVGLVVDAVSQVIDLPASRIEPPPRLGGAVDEALILGVGRINDQAPLLLDTGKLLAPDEIASLQNSA